MAQQILKFYWRKRNKSYSKDPYFLCHKTIWNGIEFCQVQYLSMQRLSNHYNCKVCHKRTRVGDGNCQDSLYPQQDPQQTSMNFCSPTIQPTRQVYKRKRFYRGLWHHPVHHEHQSFLKRGAWIMSFGSPLDTDLHRFPRWSVCSWWEHHEHLWTKCYSYSMTCKWVAGYSAVSPSRICFCVK